MGIEKRLHEYISAAGPKAKEYDAKKLLAKLRERAPYAQKTFSLVFKPHSAAEPFGMAFTGISDTLVAAHGKLGDLLHASFFHTNPHWAYRMRLRDQTPPSRSLADIRDWLGDVADELDKATQGTLLGLSGSMFEGLFDD